VETDCEHASMTFDHGMMIDWMTENLIVMSDDGCGGCPVMTSESDGVSDVDANWIWIAIVTCCCDVEAKASVIAVMTTTTTTTMVSLTSSSLLLASYLTHSASV
jgi:hypothetical protein